jgi:hypothetical protein
MNKLGCNNVECREDGVHACADLRGSYLLNTGIANIEEVRHFRRNASGGD